MTHGSLFSGIGGFDLAAEMAGIENIFSCEIDEFCNKILEKNFKNAQRFRNIKEFNGTPFRGTVNIVSGGFPCQPFSVAGKRQGKDDDRDLWPEMFRVIKEIGPDWVVGENVAGFVSMELERSLSDLEGAGYTVQPFIIPACAVGAPHRRDRIWIVANSGREYGAGRQDERKFAGSLRQTDAFEPEQPIKGNGIRAVADADNAGIRTSGIRVNANRPEIGKEREQSFSGFDRYCQDASHSDGEYVQRSFQSVRSQRAESGNELFTRLCREWNRSCGWLEVATELCGMDDGLPVRMDGFELSKAGHRAKRLKALGNAIVPEVAYRIFSAIKEIEKFRQTI